MSDTQTPWSDGYAAGKQSLQSELQWHHEQIVELRVDVDRLRANRDELLRELSALNIELGRLRFERTEIDDVQERERLAIDRANARAAELERLRANPSEDVAVLQRLLTEALEQRKTAKVDGRRLRAALRTANVHLTETQYKEYLRAALEAKP